MEDLPERFPWIFEGLSPDAIEDRLAFFRGGPLRDAPESIERLREDQRPRVSAEEMVWDDVVPVLLDLLRRECGKERSQVFEEAARFADQMREAASHGATRGEQRASLLFRHPDLDPFIPSDAHPLQSRHQNRLFRAIQIDHGVRRLTEQFEPFLSSRKRREENCEGLFEGLFERLTREVPELQSLLNHPQDVVGLTPTRAALAVWAARMKLGESRAQHMLAEARKVVRANRNPAAFAREERRSASRKRR